METLVKQHFEFNRFSLIYAEFLQEVYGSKPDIQIIDASIYYNRIMARGNMIVGITVPEELAAFLKLKFGKYLRDAPKAPAPAPVIDYSWDIPKRRVVQMPKVLYEELKELTLKYLRD